MLPSSSRHVQRALAIVLVLNAAIAVVKAVVGWRTASLTVLGAALESTLDVFNNIMGIAMVAVAARAPDEDHPYGHEKFESLGTLAIAAFLAISCFELLREALSQLIHRVEPQMPSALELALLGATAVLKAAVVWYERRRGRALDSAFLLADATHTISDVFITLLAIISLLLARLGIGIVDAPLAIIVALLIARSGYGIVKTSVPVLVDQRGVDAARIRQLIGEIPEIAAVRTVRSRSSPSGLLFTELTIGVSGDATVTEAHAIADAVEARIRAALGAAQVTVHVEPS